MAGQTRINGNLIDTGTDPEDIVSISTGDARYPKLDGPNTLSGDLTVDNGTLYVDSANNRVGVGTTSPSTALQVSGDAVASSFSGDGSNLTSVNADLLDGLNSTQFLRSDTSDTLNGDLDVVGNVNGRDIASDGSKLDTIESGADVTDTANVTAAGAVMDSELTNESAVKNIDQELTTTSSVDFGGLDVDSGTLFVDSANNRVGIGTSSPSKQLDVNGTIRSENQFQGNTSSGSSSPAFSFDGDADTGMFQASPNVLGFATNGSEAVRINSSGDVGVGRSSPDVKLDVQGSIQSLNDTGISLNDINDIDGDPNRWNNPKNSSIKLENQNQALSIIVGGTFNDRRAMIQVGHRSPNFARALGDLWLNKLGGTVRTGDDLVVNGALSVNSGGLDVDSGTLFVDSANNRVGIGTSSPNEALDVNGTANATNLTRDGSQVYSRDNILGTVSQSGGVPTGAVIESGSNSNGEFVKYADGTLICSRKEVPMNDFTTNRLRGFATLPHPFVDTEYVVNPVFSNSSNKTVLRTGTGVAWSNRISGNTAVNSHCWSNDWASSDATAGYFYDYIAIGRWY